MNHLLQYFGKFLLNLGHYESVDCSKWNGMVECNFVLSYYYYYLLLLLLFSGFFKKKLFVCWELIK